MIRLMALIAGAASVALIYLGFDGALDGREYLWAVAVLLALVSAGCLLAAEERGIAKARASREEAARQRVEALRRQDVHGTPSRDGRI